MSEIHRLNRAESSSRDFHREQMITKNPAKAAEEEFWRTQEGLAELQ